MNEEFTPELLALSYPRLPHVPPFSHYNDIPFAQGTRLHRKRNCTRNAIAGG